MSEKSARSHVGAFAIAMCHVRQRDRKNGIYKVLRMSERKNTEVIFMCQMLKFIIECRRFLYVVQFIWMASYSTLSIAAIPNEIHTAFIYRMHIVRQQTQKNPLAHISLPNDIPNLISFYMRQIFGNRGCFSFFAVVVIFLTLKPSAETEVLYENQKNQT